jgi:hypothetical protein
MQSQSTIHSIFEQDSTLILVACAAVIFSAYYVTLSPSISGGDSGELVAEGCTLGIAHPPGYPLFTLLVYLLKALIPPAAGSVAYSVNISSSVFTTLAAFLIGKMIQMFPGRPHCISGSIFSMCMFAFSPLIWQYAVTAEVFPMNTFFAALVCYLTMLFARTRELWVAILGAFVCGLAICNQHTIVLFEAPLILWMLWLLRQHLLNKVSTLLWLGSAFLAGLLPYSYIPLAANIFPQHGSWGHVKTLDGFLHHFLRRDYGTFRVD